MTTFDELKEKSDLIVVALESSCDETACAVLKNGQVLSSVISSQIDIHKEYGGVVPEIASRNHVVNVEPVVAEALEKAGITAAEKEGAVRFSFGSETTREAMQELLAEVKSVAGKFLN